MIFEQSHDLVELNFLLSAKDSLQLAIKVDETPIVCILKSILLDVLPKCGNYSSTSVFFDSQDCLKVVAYEESLWRAIEPETHFDCKLNFAFDTSDLLRKIAFYLEAVKSRATHTFTLFPIGWLVELQLFFCASFEKLNFGSF